MKEKIIELLEEQNALLGQILATLHNDKPQLLNETKSTVQPNLKELAERMKSTGQAHKDIFEQQ